MLPSSKYIATLNVFNKYFITLSFIESSICFIFFSIAFFSLFNSSKKIFESVHDNILLETINFKNINDLKVKLPNLKNYENSNPINKNVSSHNSNISKSKNNSINALVTNTSIKSNINQNLSNNNKYNNSSTNDKKSVKKKIALENINLMYNNKINNIFI